MADSGGDASTSLVQQLVTALTDASRGTILLELEHAHELTATQLAGRLGLTANNVYHHMRVLRKLGVVVRTRVVPGETYVEKYYGLHPDVRALLTQDRDWLDRIQDQASADDRQAVFVAMCLAAAQLLLRAARRYQAMDAETFDRAARGRQLGMVSIDRVSRVKLRQRLAALRQLLETETDVSTPQAPDVDLVLMIGLPDIWDPEATERP